MSLRWRFASILATVALAVSVFACLAAYVSTASQLRSGIDETLKSRAAVVNTDSGRDGLRREGGRAGEIGPDGLADGDSDSGCPPAGSFQPAAGAQLVSVDGLVTPCIEGGPALPVLPSDSSLAPDVFAFRNVRIDQDHYRVLSVAWHDGGTLQIARDLDESDSLLERLALQLAALVALATGVAAVVGWAIATRLVRPIERLRDVTHRISATLDLSTPIDVDAKGEVGDLASSFTVMVAAVSRSQEQQRRLVSDASHEMRTPLTSLRSNLDLVNQIERLPVSERSEVIADIVEDVDELSALLGELVDLASDLATAEPNESLVLGDVARTVAARIQRRSGRTVSVDDRIGLEVLARPVITT